MIARGLVLWFWMAAALGMVRGEEKRAEAEAWLARAREREARGLIRQAIDEASRAVEAAPDDPRGWLFRARLFLRTREWSRADDDFGRLIQLLPDEPGAYYERGVLRLQQGDFGGAVADFDRFAALRPARAADLWQRGIALFYANRAEDARRQFELHRDANPNDVENSAWHFACVARLEGPGKAREKWMRVEGDRRVPMNAIQALMAGEGSIEAVKAAIEAVQDPRARETAEFYGDLYLALYHGAEGRPELEARHAAAAAKNADAFGIMGAIARLHVDWVAQRMTRRDR
jgi:tetratricopeptide (TPR) repeat protein